jgi:hypothetical protein
MHFAGERVAFFLACTRQCRLVGNQGQIFRSVAGSADRGGDRIHQRGFQGPPIGSLAEVTPW